MSRNRKESAQDLLAKYVNFVMDENSSDDDENATDEESNDEEKNYENEMSSRAKEKSEGDINSVEEEDTLELDVNKSKLIVKKTKDKNIREVKAFVSKKAKDKNKKEAEALVKKKAKDLNKKEAEPAKEMSRKEAEQAKEMSRKEAEEAKEMSRKEAEQAKEMSRKEAEASFLKFHKVRRTFKSDGRIINDAPTATEPISRPQRFECEMCAKFFITEDELKNHTKMAKTMRWVCSASGRVAVKRKAPSDDFNEIALPRKKLRQMKKPKKTKKSKFGQ